MKLLNSESHTRHMENSGNTLNTRESGNSMIPLQAERATNIIPVQCSMYPATDQMSTEKVTETLVAFRLQRLHNIVNSR